MSNQPIIRFEYCCSVCRRTCIRYGSPIPGYEPSPGENPYGKKLEGKS